MLGCGCWWSEDEAKMAKLLSRGLAEEGYAVDVAGRGEDALWMAQAAGYDAIVLDVMLPGLDAVWSWTHVHPVPYVCVLSVLARYVGHSCVLLDCCQYHWLRTRSTIPRPGGTLGIDRDRSLGPWV
jgi:chemotaxis response regulator CheB